MTRTMAKRFRGAGAQRDANEADVIAALEARGCVVQQLAGAGVPDLLVWVPAQQRLVLIEVKDGTKKKLRMAQTVFFAKWSRLGAPVFRVSSVDEAVAIVGRFAA